MSHLAVNGAKLGAKRSIEVTIDVTILSDWVFPTKGYPREPVYLST